VNISTQNVLAESNIFEQGHGVSIGSETSGWVRNITIRDSVLNGTNLAVRIKSMRGRGGGVEDVLYENLTGSVVSAIQLTLNYQKASPTNVTATPELRGITVRNVHVEVSKSNLDCEGLAESVIQGIVFDNVTVTGKEAKKFMCSECRITADPLTDPQPCNATVPTPAPTPTPPKNPTPPPAPTPPTPPAPHPTPSPDCDPAKCIDRCIAKYGGDIADQKDAYACSKGCAGMSGGKETKPDKFCSVSPDTRKEICEKDCSSGSSNPVYIADCKYGCSYWAI
jgi:hypothetical protein